MIKLLILQITEKTGSSMLFTAIGCPSLVVDDMRKVISVLIGYNGGRKQSS
jgi:hypothetical protein